MKQGSIYFVPCPTEGSNLTEGASLFCPKQKQGRDFYRTVASLSPNVSFSTPGLVMNVPDLTSYVKPTPSVGPCLALLP